MALRGPFRGRVLTLVLATATCLAGTLRSADLRPDYQPVAYAIKNARIVAAPGRVVENGTVVVRQGIIESVGPTDKVEVPHDAEPIDGTGLIVYPGFIDAYTSLGVPAGVNRSETGPGEDVPTADFALARTPEDDRHGITPEFDVAAVFDLGDNLAADRRELGFTSLIAAPAGAIATGQSAFVSLAGRPRREAILKAPVALHVNLRPPFEPDPPRPPASPPSPPGPTGRRRFGGASYPNSLMGAVAHLRQAMLDADYHKARRAYFEKHGATRPPFDPALDALAEARSRTRSVWWEASTRDEIHRALDLAEEFGTDAVILGGREAPKVAERLKALDVPVVLRLDFPDEPKAPTPDELRAKPPEERIDPIRLLQDRHARWKERVAVPAALAKAGVRFAFSTDGLSKAETFPAQVRKVIRAGLTEDDALAALTSQPAAILGMTNRLGAIEPGKLGHLVVMTAPFKDDKARVKYLFIDGRKFDLDKDRERDKKSGEDRKSGDAASRGTQDRQDDRPAKKEKETDPARAKSAREPDASRMKREAPAAPPAPLVDFPIELDEDRKPALKTNGTVFVKGPIILTGGPQGTIANGSILVRDGKIAAVGTDLVPPEGVPVIDAAGMVAMPGIIDTHAHYAIQGGVNETSLSLVPEVRVRDVVIGDDVAIYRAAAGGTTTARLLHGSSNTVGGQDAVIKLRYDLPARELLLKDPRRPQGVKFALGENVTRLTGRFPNTRMGVEAALDRAFEEARAYRRRIEEARDAAAQGKPVPPVRRDLRLEAFAAILDGSIKIHSHCYRADEILMLLNVAERFGIRVQSLQHVLEGYKVAPEIAAHGASASTFSDWWAYKIEAYDAIPYNAALLTEAGVRVCIKSDSNELTRHLYLEAAKMLRYGGVPEAEALAMITMNPARELGLEHRLGSIEVGKDADIAIFNAHPFDSFARCELTLIEGEVAFQRSRDKLSPRPGDHHSSPRPSAEVLARALDLSPSPVRRYAITGATVHPVSGPDVPNGTVIVANGAITAVGGPDTPIPDGARAIDARGLDVWPGLIDAGSVLGLFEIGSLRETQDTSDSAQLQPELRAGVALRADSELIPVTRANGVLAAFVQPLGGLIAGQGAVIKLHGWVPRDLVLQGPAALCVNVPGFVPTSPERRRGPGDNDPNRQRNERLDTIKDAFERALDYDRVVRAARARNLPGPVPDPRLDALLPYARGEKPVIFRADHRVEIRDALKLARELKLKAVISGGLEAWKIADEIKAANVPVLIAGTLRLPGESTDVYDAAYANPARLHKAGVKFAFRSQNAGPDAATGPRNVPFEAATAVAYGLPEDVALKAVTLAPAEVLGVADRLGSLEPGKLANIVITAGHVLQATSEVKGLMIAGEPLPPRSRHTDLYDKYRRRLEEVRSGSVPLGLERPAPTPVAGGDAGGR